MGRGHPLAQNQRFIAELAERLPGTGQHPSIIEVPPGLHPAEREAEALQLVVSRFEAMRLRVRPGLAEADVLPDAGSVTLAPPCARDTALAEAGAFLAEPIPLHRDAPWQFLVVPLAPAGSGHLLAIKASHIAGDAPSRFQFIRERVAALSPTEPRRPASDRADREWRRYQEWEAGRLGTLDLAASLEPLAGGVAWDFGPGLRDRHAGMRLGAVCRRPAPPWCRVPGRHAIALFVTALGRLAVAEGLTPFPLVAVPHSFRRQSRCLRGFGDFVDHLVVPVAAGPGVGAVLAATAGHLDRELASAVPLRVRLRAAGRDAFEDPAPFTQATVSFQPSSAVAAPYLLALPGERAGLYGQRGERTLPVAVPVVPLERQDVSVVCCVHRGELRWRLSTRTDVVDQGEHDRIEPLLERAVGEVCTAPGPST